VSGALAVGWRPRARPLDPAAVYAAGEAAAALARACLGRPLPASLRGVWAPEMLALCGPAGELPWAEGVDYFGTDPAAPALLLPTHSEPSVPAALLERAVLRAVAAPPVLVVPHPPRLVSVARARPFGPERLRAWLAGAIA
jgi:MoxR-vWA-beta-propeller ternary system protein